MPGKARPAGNRGKGKRGPGQRVIEGANFRLVNEVRYIIRRAADHDGRVVTIGQLTLFSSETGDAWIIDRDDHLALRLARDGDGWKVDGFTFRMTHERGNPWVKATPGQ